MPAQPAAIESLGDGKYRVTLSEDERFALRRLPGELIPQIKALGDSTTFRLFPPGYSEDIVRQAEYDRLMRDELENSHIAALATLQETADAEILDEQQLTAWMKAINQLRLVLGTRLGVTDDWDYDDVDPSDPSAGAWGLYLYLGHLLEEAVEAMSFDL